MPSLYLVSFQSPKLPSLLYSSQAAQVVVSFPDGFCQFYVPFYGFPVTSFTGVAAEDVDGGVSIFFEGISKPLFSSPFSMVLVNLELTSPEPVPPLMV